MAVIQLGIWGRGLFPKMQLNLKAIAYIGAWLLISGPSLLIAVYYFHVLRKIVTALIQRKNPFSQLLQPGGPPLDCVAQYKEVLGIYDSWSFLLPFGLVVGLLLGWRLGVVEEKTGDSLPVLALRPPLYAACAVVVYLALAFIFQLLGLGSVSVRWCQNIAIWGYTASWLIELLPSPKRAGPPPLPPIR